ncbi:MAG: hypothetical protein WD602_01695 [Actinomycetota bacterium]
MSIGTLTAGGARLQSVPYKSDDLPQKMAKYLWLPMLAMGLMAVVIGLGAAISAGINIGDFFSASDAESLKDASTTMAWTSATIFLGMAFILSSITMLLVNIVRTLRDTGHDVQVAVRAGEVTQLRKPLTGRLIPVVMMMGLMIVIGAFVVGIVQADKLSGIPAGGIADTATLQGQDLADYGTVQAFDAWVGPLRLFGLATIFASIVLALRTIIQAIRFQGQRIQELAGGRFTPAA